MPAGTGRPFTSRRKAQIAEDNARLGALGADPAAGGRLAGVLAEIERRRRELAPYSTPEQQGQRRVSERLSPIVIDRALRDFRRKK